MFAGTSDDEPLLGMERERGVGTSEAHCCGELRVSSRPFKWKGKSCSDSEVSRAALAMVTFLSWMANVRTSLCTVRIPVWIRSGLTLRSVGLSSTLLPVLCGQE